MNLLYKQDMDEARRRWDAFWAKTILDRPLVGILATKTGVQPVPPPRMGDAWRQDYDALAEQFEHFAETHLFLGDRVPCLEQGFGPDQFAAFLGGNMELDEKGTTSWAVPFVTDWDRALPFRLDPHNVWWQRILDMTSALARRAAGRYIVSHIDLHSHADALVAMRGMQDLILDMMDIPDAVERAMRSVRRLYAPIYDGVYRTGNMAETGTSSWTAFYSSDRFNMIECDLIGNIGPDLFRRFIRPAIAEEAEYLDNAIFHLDGVGALKHLDDILGIPAIHGVQWVPGAGQPRLPEWLDVLKKIHGAGKSVHAYGNADEVRILYRALGPERVFYDVEGVSEKEAYALLDWFAQA